VVGQFFLGALFGSLGAGDVNLIGAFGGVSQDSDVVRGYFQETAGYGREYSSVPFESIFRPA